MVRGESEERAAVGQRLRQARVAAGFATAQEMADFLGISHARYSGWERGESLPNSVTLLRAMCEALDVTPGFLLFGDTMGLSRGTFQRLAKL
jgi:transcriptional regulator with XRE-family HTH domain